MQTTYLRAITLETHKVENALAQYIHYTYVNTRTQVLTNTSAAGELLSFQRYLEKWSNST